MSAYEPFPADEETNRLVHDDERLASRGRRFGALLLDWLIIAVVGFLAAMVIYVGFDEDDVAVVLLYLSWLVLALLYYPLTMRRSGAHNGQTFGKQALRIRVVTAEGVPVTFGRAARRDVLGTTVIGFFTSGLYALVDYPFGLFSENRQCVHDKIGNTYVFRADAEFGQGAPPSSPTPPPEPTPPAREPERARNLWSSPTPPDKAREEINRAFGR